MANNEGRAPKEALTDAIPSDDKRAPGKPGAPSYAYSTAGIAGPT